LNGLFAFFDKRTKYGKNNQNKVMQDYHRFLEHLPNHMNYA